MPLLRFYTSPLHTIANALGSSFHSASTITRFCSTLGGIAGLHFHGFLQQDGPAVTHFVDKVDGSAGHLHAALQRFLMHFQAIEAGAAKAGNQAGVNIQDSAG